MEREEEYLVLGCNSVVVVVVAGKLEVLELCVRLVVEREEDEDREVERREDGRPSWCLGEAVVVDMGCVWEVATKLKCNRSFTIFFWGAEGTPIFFGSPCSARRGTQKFWVARLSLASGRTTTRGFKTSRSGPRGFRMSWRGARGFKMSSPGARGFEG